MMDITKEELYNLTYKETPKWRNPNDKRKLRNIIKSHKLMTVGAVCLSICLILNLILIYNFFRVLSML